jgi:hypothetical protein
LADRGAAHNAYEPGVRAQARVVRLPGSDALLWTIAGLKPGTIAYLRYQLPYCTVTVSRGASVLSAQIPPIGMTGTYIFEVANAGPQTSVDFTLWDARITRAEIALTIDGVPGSTADRVQNGSYSISLGVPRGGKTKIVLVTGRDEDAA